jgi:hypothetical protein
VYVVGSLCSLSSNETNEMQVAWFDRGEMICGSLKLHPSEFLARVSLFVELRFGKAT